MLDGRSQNRSGFTLVEMLAATIVISMLLTALVSISRASARQAKQANDLRLKFPSTAIVADQITRDVRNADGYAAVDGGVILFGAISSDPATGNGTHQIARVTYAVRDVQGQQVLVRTEEQPRRPGHQRIVWIGTSGLSISPVGSVDNEEVDLNLTGGLSPMSMAFRVELSGSDGNAIWSQRVRHHMEVR
jgi:prepilin-type N-terminal cleavage/methylation domain-containing protein